MAASSSEHPIESGSEVVSTEVLIIGGGVTGAGIMRDLALRGIHSILIEKKTSVPEHPAATMACCIRVPVMFQTTCIQQLNAVKKMNC